MLLSFFRINDPYRLLGLLLVLILLGLPFFIDPAVITIQELKSLVLGEAIGEGKKMYAQVIDSTAPITSSIYGFTNTVFGRSLLARHIIALMVIFYQASFFAILLINNKAYNDSTYVPGLIFGLLCFFSFDLLSFSPELLGSTVLLLALNNLFKEIEFRIQRDEIILNLGIYLGVASLLIFSYTIFLFVTILILFLFTRLDIRKLILLLFGFSLPHLILFTVYFLWGETGALWQNFYLPNLTVSGQMLVSVRTIFVLGAIPITYFIFSLFMLNREARFTKYQSQLFQVMFQWLLCCVVQLFLTREFTPHSLVIFIPPLAYFTSHYVLLIRRRWIAETMLWTFLLGMLAVNLAGRYGQMDSIDYSRLFAKPSSIESIQGERVMVLKDDPGMYLNNRMGGYFLDWSLSKEILEQPDYYENVVMMDEALQMDAPQRIIDPEGFMLPYFERLPGLQALYKKDGEIYKRIK